MSNARALTGYSPRVARTSILSAGVFLSFAAHAAPVTYTGFVVTDVTLGTTFYHNAEVTLKFYGDTTDIRSFAVTAPDGGTGNGYLIDRGRATVEIRSVSGVVRATFAPRKVFVSFDQLNGGIGFSSYIGPNGLEPAYPLGLSDIGGGPPGQLATPTNITGNAWSCVGFPPFTSPTGDCLDPTPYPLSTDHGNLFIYNPYEAFRLDFSISSFSGTLNRGIFSVVLSSPEE